MSDLERLRDLPVRTNAHNPAPAARAAFEQAFQPLPTRIFASLARAVVPVALASIVGLYLMWAFTAAIALNQ